MTNSDMVERVARAAGITTEQARAAIGATQPEPRWKSWHQSCECIRCLEFLSYQYYIETIDAASQRGKK